MFPLPIAQYNAAGKSNSSLTESSTTLKTTRTRRPIANPNVTHVTLDTETNPARVKTLTSFTRIQQARRLILGDRQKIYSDFHYKLDIHGSNPGMGNDFSSPKRPYQLWDPNQCTKKKGTGSPFPRSTRPGR